MQQNPPDLRPDLARARIPDDRPGDRRDGQPTIGMVSLGCPKALVDSERILTRLRAEGYAISADYHGADAVVVNTCGFLDSAKAESLDAIGEALRENGRVIVTGCLGAEPDYITGAHPKVLAVTGPHQYEQVLDAVHGAVPPKPDPFIDLLPASGVSLTPRHYSYLKISEGCNHKCKFCIIPDMRGRLVSRPAHAVVRDLHVATDVIQRAAGVGAEEVDQQLLFATDAVFAPVRPESSKLFVANQSRQQIVGDRGDRVVAAESSVKRIAVFVGHESDLRLGLHPG